MSVKHFLILLVNYTAAVLYPKKAIIILFDVQLSQLKAYLDLNVKQKSMSCPKTFIL